MKVFAYRAVHADGRIHKGRMMAANENELTFQLREINLELIEAKTTQTRTTRRQLARTSYLATDRITLCGQLEDMCGAGVSLIDALVTITETMSQGAMRNTLVNIVQDIRSGQSLSRAFAEDQALFDPVTLAILRAGETSGNLTTTFERITKHLKAEDRIHRKLQKALRYPLFLLCVAGGVITFMMILVVPQIITFLTSLDHDLPFMTRLLIRCADVFATVWWLLPLLLVSTALILHLARTTHSKARVITDRWLLSVPALGPVLRKLAMTRLTTSLSLLIKSSFTVPDALKISVATLGNAALEKSATHALQQLEEGRPLSCALATLFPLPILQMLRIGEASGQMTKALEHIAQNYDREAQDSVDVLLGVIEPALTLFVGALLAWIVLAVLGPVYSSLAPLSQGM
ncbi:MAG: type II secretion system F family protein [Alphaproteobacteria bacterium]|nr:type II secretion system F family protein [Alphaproteobacteria bacterium]